MNATKKLTIMEAGFFRDMGELFSWFLWHASSSTSGSASPATTTTTIISEQQQQSLLYNNQQRRFVNRNYF